MLFLVNCKSAIAGSNPAGASFSFTESDYPSRVAFSMGR